MTGESAHQKNKRIAKNTILLYIRTFVLMCINLFTSRLILQALGIDNFGIYNVVGGFVSMFSIISGSLSGSVSRYITFGLGKGNLENLRTVFSSSVNVMWILSFIIILVGETVGIWYINFEMNLPPHRLYAANWVLQCSIATFVLNLLATPYLASITAHEKMGVYAYFSILEVVLKLGFVYYLFVTKFDKLITYAVCLLFIAVLLRFLYFIYCKRKFEECRYHFVINKPLLKEMTSFAWWNFLGNTAYIFNTQGVNMAVNSFFGVAFNAARGIVGQAEGAVMQLVNNFTTAFNPQITKSYAEGNKDYMFDLMCRGTKFSFFLFMFILIPFEFCADTILSIWLTTVPPDAPLFLRLDLLCSGTMLLGGPFYTGIMATGNIRNYQIVITLVGFLVFPLTLGAYYLGAPVQISYIIYFIIYQILIWIRMDYAKKLLDFPISRFTKFVFLPIIYCCLLSCILPALIYFLMNEGVIRLVVIGVTSIFSSAAIIYFLGLDHHEKAFVENKLRLGFLKLGIVK